ncbi:TrkH family potassium uptake protein [Halovulum dunhuangense]|uniref:TrkH family potassium uptake protein n=1 Tax=Halovulum dunhuangense TaxID=1505036 RepID=A0A849L2Z9_9RHOB|nr:TrkH family potassium uptake protein [Halovulum dunhuangense]NNU80633.1 TrkH family potassium uptake protein [Halovulum dunhuangense]
MAAALRDIPPLACLLIIAALMMMGPALHALWLEEYFVGRVFFWHGMFFLVIGSMIAMASSRARPAMRPGREILTLLLAYAALPVMLATPMVPLAPTFTFGQLYFEMVSCLTTTGATVFDAPERLPDPVHLWRGMVGWAGGFLILVAAVAILQPLNLGGFEIRAAMARGQGEAQRALRTDEPPSLRLGHHALALLPIYAGLTLALTFGLMAAGDRALVALVHAMSVLSTSGITPLRDFSQAASGHVGEALVLVFIVIAISRRSTTLGWRQVRGRPFDIGPEYRLAAVAVLGVTALLFLRHFVGAYEVSVQEDVVGALSAFWGTLFNTLSFMSTTGFNSRDWAAAQDWSALQTPGLILLTLCMMGGGIATTTGGVKLLRVYALYKHGVREMQRMIHPNSVGGAGVTARRIRREGAQIAFVFVMLLLLASSLLLLILTALGTNFDVAMALGVAALTNTGPAAELIIPNLSYGLLEGPERLVLSAAMILGRVEVLVLISLFNPDFWRE